MSIQRVPEIPFAQIANSALRDTRLSFKARGILAMVLSHSGEWEASRDWLERQSTKDGRAAIQSALNELTEYGYRAVHKEYHEGQIRTVVQWFQQPETISRPTENLTVRIPDGQETRRSIEHNPSEHNLSEHHHQDTFDEFWSIYPRRQAKGAAVKAWAKAIRVASPEVIIAGARRYRDDPNRHDEFTAHAATWLNHGRWEDEPLPSATVKQSGTSAYVGAALALSSMPWELEGAYDAR